MKPGSCCVLLHRPTLIRHLLRSGRFCAWSFDYAVRHLDEGHHTGEAFCQRFASLRIFAQHGVETLGRGEELLVGGPDVRQLGR
ncbi:hypothetical protein [Cupriavidus alkaliphilus]|uniref:Uncharacterized protein n=1 Tax=Cupriavidus alkaliphilus TaxID=942866 RepID=A0A7W4YT80_9BURK|nr:hypothetical protein [Cupriavidus alkaliphilus]MBB3009222.1 hypothetical protein [Cupriavidus alkaliphilus]